MGCVSNKSPNRDLQPGLKLPTSRRGHPGQGVHKDAHLEVEGHLLEMKG